MAKWVEIPPPTQFTVPADRKVVLYAPDGTSLVRPIGFVPSTPPQKANP